jgi:ribosomal protein S7
MFLGDALYVGLWLLFLFLPFFTKIKIGAILELEREVQQAKDELREFKSEVRNSMSVLSTNVNTIGGMTNQVTVNIPGLDELRQARQLVEERSPPTARQSAERVEERILLQSEDQTLALAKTRIDMERLLRKILGRRTGPALGKNDSTKFAGINQLFDLFLKDNEQYSYLRQPFHYVTQICNAAIHAQRVSPEQTQEALALGAQLIAVLEQSAGEPE